MNRFISAAAVAFSFLSCHRTQTVDIQGALHRIDDGFRTGAAEIDVFGDGRAYIRRRFQGSVVTRTEVSYDGVVGLVEERQGSTLVVTFTPNGVPFRKLESSPLDGGRFSVRLTRYATEASSPDLRLSYDDDPAAATNDVTEEQDSAHDGSFTVTRTYVKPRGRRELGISGGGPGSNCGPSQIAALKDAIDKAQTDGLACLDALNPLLATSIAAYLESHTIDVACGGTSSQSCAEFFSTIGGNGSIVIYSPGCPGAPLAGIILHELLHADGLYGDHEHSAPESDPTDRIYGCESTCFGHATSLTCSACIGVPNGTGSCGKYPYEDCPKAYCGCSKTVYRTEAECLSHCGVDPGSDPFACALGGICGPPPSLVCR